MKSQIQINDRRVIRRCHQTMYSWLRGPTSCHKKILQPTYHERQKQEPASLNWITTIVMLCPVHLSTSKKAWEYHIGSLQAVCLPSKILQILITAPSIVWEKYLKSIAAMVTLSSWDPSDIVSQHWPLSESNHKNALKIHITETKANKKILGLTNLVKENDENQRLSLLRGWFRIHWLPVQNRIH